MGERMVVPLIILAVASVVVIWLFAAASVENTRLKTEAAVAKSQEHTKRAEGRHNLLDVAGNVLFLRRNWGKTDEPTKGSQ
jgi:hypothetical protein